jgi:hypothetical protein
MAIQSFLLLLSIAASPAGSVRLDLPGGGEDVLEDVTLQYDDGTPVWLNWGGVYRGVWFNTSDFQPGEFGFLLKSLEFWFYEHSAYPWETAQFYAEVWNGDQNGPVELLDSQEVTAVHYAAVFSLCDPPLDCEINFWGLMNTNLSDGGWPSILGDGTPGEHSFYSDSMTVWEPWGLVGDYLLRAHGGYPVSLERTTWGAVKALF